MNAYQRRICLNLLFNLSCVVEIPLANMALPSLTVESFTFNTPPSLDGNPPLKMAAKRYTDGRQSKDGLTILLTHGTGTRESYRNFFACGCSFH
jgi:hypothetical protein